jgi:hypothetical protein
MFRQTETIDPPPVVEERLTHSRWSRKTAKGAAVAVAAARITQNSAMVQGWSFRSFGWSCRWRLISGLGGAAGSTRANLIWRGLRERLGWRWIASTGSIGSIEWPTAAAVSSTDTTFSNVGSDHTNSDDMIRAAGALRRGETGQDHGPIAVCWLAREATNQRLDDDDKTRKTQGRTHRHHTTSASSTGVCAG